MPNSVLDLTDRFCLFNTENSEMDTTLFWGGHVPFPTPMALVNSIMNHIYE